MGENDKEYRSWGLGVSLFITFCIFFTYIFTVNVLKNLFPFFTPIINQENLIFLFAFLVSSSFQYLLFWGTNLAMGDLYGIPSDYKTEFKIETTISLIVLLSSLILPFFISFFYLKNVYPTFEHFFSTGEPNWIVYLTIFLINHIIFFIGSLIIVKNKETIEKIIYGIFGFPCLLLISIFISAPLVILYFISKIVPFFFPLCVNCSTGDINWLSIIGLFLIYFALYIPLVDLCPWVMNNVSSVFNFIEDIFIKKTYFDKEDIEKELIKVVKKTVKKSKYNPDILKDSNLFKSELKKIAKKSKLVNFLDKEVHSNYSYGKYIDYIDNIDDEILNLYFDSDENIIYRLDLVKSIFENNRKKSEKFLDYYFIDHIMDSFYKVLELDKIDNSSIKYKNVKLNDKIFEKLYKIGLINTPDKFALNFISMPKIFKFEDKYYKITKIGKKFFKDCTNLKEIIIPESVTKIGDYAFKNCENLKKIVFPKKLTEIGISAFENCTYLNISYKISFDYLEKIGKYAFKNCKNIESLDIGKKINKIEKGTFENCHLLENIHFSSYYIPKKIGDYAFKNCKSLDIYSSKFEKVKYIGKKAFYGCKSLREIEFKNILQIADKSFAYCSSIKEVKISDTIEKIGDYAFKGCKSLNQIIVPSKVKNIGIGAFQNIDSVFYTGNLDTNRFYSKNLKREMNIALNNDILEKLYKQEPFRFKLSDDNVHKPFDEIKEKIISIEIPENFTYDGLKYNIKEIGSRFEYLKSLKTIILPNTITKICNLAFIDCNSLTDIVIPDSVTILEESTFKNCQKLTNVKLSKNLIEIGYHCFYYCKSLKEITIPDSVKNIGEGAFSYCTKLEKVKLPKNITKINHTMFNSCYSLKEIKIPDSVTEIGSCAFGYCNSSLNFEIPNSVKKIGKEAFAEKVLPKSFCCASGRIDEVFSETFYLLNNKHDKNRYIRIPDSVTEIGDYAFNGIEHIYYKGKAKNPFIGFLRKNWGAKKIN